MMRDLVLCVVLVLASCGQRPTLADKDLESASPAAGSSQPAGSTAVTTTTPATSPSCAPATVLLPAVLAVRWPALLGRRVRLRVQPLRAISMTEWLVMAGGQRFVVDAPPDTVWGAAHVFVVAGSTIAPVRGRTSLPELVLDDDCGA